MFTIFKDHNYNEPIMVADTFDDVLILFEENARCADLELIALAAHGLDENG